MEPRLPSSRQWTPLPPELQKQMQGVFEQGFRSQLGNAHVDIEGRIYPGELLLAVGFSRPNQLKQPSFEVSVDYNVKKDNVLKLFHTIFDAAGALFDQYFQTDDDAEFPRIWEQLEFEGRKIYVQYSTANKKLESEADQLLGTKADGLVIDEPEQSEEQLAEIKAKLGLANDEEDQ